MTLDELEEQLEVLRKEFREHVAATERIQAISAREAIRALREIGPPPGEEKP